MPKKPQNNDSKNQSENSSSDSPHSDHGDDIDDLELEPISSRLPGDKAADSIPSKPVSEKDGVLTGARPDDTIAGSLDADFMDKSDDQRKSAGRMYPSGKEVNLTTDAEEIPTAPEPESKKMKLPIAAAEDDESTMDDDIKELIIDGEPLPDVATKGVDPFVEEPQASNDQAKAPERKDDAYTRQSINLDVKKKNSMSVIEKGSLGIFLLLVIVGLVVYVPQMIPEGQLTNNIVDVADTPIELEGITIETLEGRWTETVHIASRVRRNVKWTPEVELAISGSGSGVLRLLFLDQDGRQRGDTMDVAFANGKFQPSMQSSAKIYCTHGLTSELELKDLRARGDSWWTVRLLKGQDLKAPSSEFETIIEMKIPFEIVVSEN